MANLYRRKAAQTELTDGRDGLRALLAVPIAKAPQPPIHDDVQGTSDNDTLNGTPNADNIRGLGGNDVLSGLGGNDTLQGGDGDDELDGGDGDDFIYGGDSSANNFPDDDNIMRGGTGTDFIYGGNGNDLVHGGADNDVLLDGKGGSNTMHGEGGNDQIEVSGQNFNAADYPTNILSGGDGNDTITARQSNGSLSGGAGNDILYADRGNMTLDGGADNDELRMGWAVVMTDGIQIATGGTGTDVFVVADTSRFNARDRVLDFNSGEGDKFALDDVSTGRTGFFWARSGASVVWRGALDPALFVPGSALPPGEFPTGFVGIWYTQSGGNTYLIADSDADLVFDADDMVVELSGLITLAASDFRGDVFGATYGTANADTINGSAGNDTIYGLAGDDQLNGGNGGFDFIDGGDGNDVIDATLSSRGSLFGKAGNDVITGSNQLAGDLIEGGIGDDILYGLNGADDMFGQDGNDIVRGGIEQDRLDGGNGNDVLEGGSGADTLEGFEGDDILRGGTEDDWLSGGNGIDTADYSDITSGAVTVSLLLTNQQTGAGGFDLIFATVENVTGTAFADTLTGDEQANVLDGGGGADTLAGNQGNDVYFVDHAGDIVTDNAGEGIDEIRTTLASFSLSGLANTENLSGSDPGQTLGGNGLSNILKGEGGNDTLFGFDGVDYLVGGAGADIMVGGLGDDVYYIDDTSDAITEVDGEGNDRIAATITLALAADANIERIEVVNLTSTNAMDLTGSGIGNVIYGNDGQNILRGEAGNDELRGFGGNDFLVGGSGTDLMVGGLGDDTFYIDDASDAVGEIADQGNDRIAASVSFVLSNGANVELLEAVNLLATTAFDLTGSDSNNTITGNNGVNILKGEGGNDVLSSAGGDDFLVGGSGVDSMTGGAGDDTYYVDDAADAVFEIAGEGANDRVSVSVSYALAANAEIERLEAANSAGTAAIDLTGSASGNAITGNDGVNILNGGNGGNDVLAGLGGADAFAFTTALGAANADVIVDFVSGIDRIALDDAVFGGLNPGAVPGGAFVIGTQAADADDRIVYNQATGQLFYDADGSGGRAAILFATLSGNPALAASDFTVI